MKKMAISLTIALSSISLNPAFAKNKGLSVEIVKPSSGLATVVKSEDQMVYQKVSLTGIEDLKQTKDLLLKVKAGKESLMSEFDLKKDYFHTVDIAAAMIDEMISSGQDFSDLQKDSRFQDLISILNALRNKSESPTDGEVRIGVNVLSKIAETVHKPEITLPADSSGVPSPVLMEEAVLSQELQPQPLIADPKVVCEYAGPKSGYGFKPGMKVRCGDEKLKLKFGGETNSGPFDSRIFRALKFVTPRIDFTPGLEMKYDRAFITEFNSRKPTHFNVLLAGKKLYSHEMNNEKRDALSFVQALRLKSGQVLSGAELEVFKKEFRTGSVESPVFNEALEQQIETVIFTAGSVVQDVDGIEAGPWRFDEPAHMQNQSLRVQLVLNIWLGNTDTTTKNNRLLILKSKNAEKKTVYQLLPIYVDIGFGLGASDRKMRQTSSDIEHIPDVMSKRTGHDKLQFQFISKASTLMLEKLTFDDSIKALQLMCSFSQESLRQALLQSGVESPLAEVGAKKLIHRRNQFMRDLGVERVFGASCRP